MKIRMIALLALPTLLLAGCDNLNRSLLFYTQTNVGIEVGVDPAQQSGKVLIGYKRAEGVVNPVYQPPGYEENGKRKDADAKDVYLGEAYSVMAKIAGEAGGRGSAGQSAQYEAAGKIAQWFATGEAAKLLAKNEYAAAALTGSSETAKAIAQQPRLGDRISEGNFFSDDSISDLSEIVDEVRELAMKDSSTHAIIALRELDLAAAKLSSSIKPVEYYLENDETIQVPDESNPGQTMDLELTVVSKAAEPWRPLAGDVDGAFMHWIALQESLNSSAELLKAVIDADPKAYAVQVSATAEKVFKSPEIYRLASEELIKVKEQRMSFKQQFNSDQELVVALRKVVKIWAEQYIGAGS